MASLFNYFNMVNNAFHSSESHTFHSADLTHLPYLVSLLRRFHSFAGGFLKTDYWRPATASKGRLLSPQVPKVCWHNNSDHVLTEKPAIASSLFLEVTRDKSRHSSFHVLWEVLFPQSLCFKRVFPVMICTRWPHQEMSHKGCTHLLQAGSLRSCSQLESLTASPAASCIRWAKESNKDFRGIGHWKPAKRSSFWIAQNTWICFLTISRRVTIQYPLTQGISAFL